MNTMRAALMNRPKTQQRGSATLCRPTRSPSLGHFPQGDRNPEKTESDHPQPLAVLTASLTAELTREFGAAVDPLAAVLETLKESAQALDAQPAGERRHEQLADFLAQIDQLEALLDLLATTGERQ